MSDPAAYHKKRYHIVLVIRLGHLKRLALGNVPIKHCREHNGQPREGGKVEHVQERLVKHLDAIHIGALVVHQHHVEHNLDVELVEDKRRLAKVRPAPVQQQKALQIPKNALMTLKKHE